MQKSLYNVSNMSMSLQVKFAIYSTIIRYIYAVYNVMDNGKVQYMRSLLLCT